jgi:cation-transporting ATPase 13A3/4/5
VVFGIMFVLGISLFTLVLILFQINGSPKSTVIQFATGIFTISQVLSPLLPLALVVGEVAASTRLSARDVFCINPKRIAISGKVRVCGFDKTGTITKEGLDFRGVRQISSTQAKFSDDGIISFDAIPQTASDPFSDSGHISTAPPSLEETETETNLLVQGLATCHAVSMYGTEFVGNQVEVKMFTATKFTIVNVPGQPLCMRGPVGGVVRDIEVIKRFEFDHARMSMSVLVRSNGVVYAFCKGAAEKMQTTFVPGSMPEDFIFQSQEDASNGFYVLALGFKSLGKMSPEDALAMKREDVEQDMKPLGLILFRNELKEDSRGAITKLREGDVRCVMITGDNAQTGLYVAKASSLISDTRRVFLADAKIHAPPHHGSDALPSSYQQGSIFDGTDVVFWREMGLKTQDNVQSTAQILDMCRTDATVELAMTGRAFSHFVISKATMDQLLFRTRIFARFSPTQKSDTINLFIAKGQVTAMCGDGGNDCGALRAAHVGLALSEAEASVVSPFTSKTKSIHSMVDLLREGRCALATSFASYKFVLTYVVWPRRVCFFLGGGGGGGVLKKENV